MTVVFILVLITAVSATTLKNILKSPKETLELFQRFKEAKHLHFQPEEERWRVKLFKESAEEVAALNSDVNEEAEYELNKFSVMTDDERNRYLGVNGTLMDLEDAPAPPSRLMKRSVVPESKIWIYDGLVTQPTNQINCGSCWAYGAMAAIEGRYKQETGILRKFSEQELLDCTYEDSLIRVKFKGGEYGHVHPDGCEGGWYYFSFDHVKKTGRLASAKDYPYHAHDCACEGPKKRNSLIAAKITGYVKVGKSEDEVIEALSRRVLSVAFKSTKKFSAYKRGLFKDPECASQWPNHAVAMVGYTSTYVLVKNSWGDDWGDHGFIRFKRNHDHCHLWNYAMYPEMDQTGVVDVLGADDSTDYDPADTDPHPDCDKYADTRSDCDVTECAELAEEGVNWAECKRTCNHCTRLTEYTGECPAGTQFCNGACLHEHFCS